MNPFEHNKQTYRAGNIVSAYLGEEALQLPEAAILEEISMEIRDGKILDIGIGGGRTTPFLMELSDDYLGVDYSEEMVKRSRLNHPNADLRSMDARDLSGLGFASFDFILFSFNGIDYVDDADRRKILASIKKALKPNGLFAFSSHNLDWWSRNPNRPGAFTFRRGLRENLSELKRFLVENRNFRRNKRYETIGSGYSIVNDRAHRFSLLTYYISVEAQQAQLKEAGFRGEVKCFARDGSVVQRDSQSGWIYYLVRND